MEICHNRWLLIMKDNRLFIVGYEQYSQLLKITSYELVLLHKRFEKMITKLIMFWNQN